MVRTLTLMPLTDLVEGRGRHCKVEELDLAVFRIGEAVYAIADSCPHQGASLANGKLQGCVVACPAHGLKFDVRTGACTASPDLQSKSYPVRVVNGQVVLDIEDESQSARLPFL